MSSQTQDASQPQERTIIEERIAKDQWAVFLKDCDHTHYGDEACIAIMGQEFGDQEEAAWLPLSGISYDTHADQIIVTAGGISSRSPAHLTHMISQPTRSEAGRRWDLIRSRASSTTRKE